MQAQVLGRSVLAVRSSRSMLWIGQVPKSGRVCGANVTSVRQCWLRREGSSRGLGANGGLGWPGRPDRASGATPDFECSAVRCRLQAAPGVPRLQSALWIRCRADGLAVWWGFVVQFAYKECKCFGCWPRSWFVGMARETETHNS